jgi:hypothetical protein
MSGWNDLSGLLIFRPLESPLPVTGPRRWSQFSAGWAATVDLLAKEINHLKPKHAILEADLDESDLRLDGFPRSSARWKSDGVRLTLVGTPHGDLRYPCTTFYNAEDNVRAIALSLESLRKVDRYGVTKRGEQYAGWKQLNAPAGEGNSERGRKIIAEHGSLPAALKAVHPDTGGSAEDFRDVMAAKENT